MCLDANKFGNLAIGFESGHVYVWEKVDDLKKIFYSINDSNMFKVIIEHSTETH